MRNGYKLFLGIIVGIILVASLITLLIIPVFGDRIMQLIINVNLNILENWWNSEKINKKN